MATFTRTAPSKTHPGFTVEYAVLVVDTRTGFPRSVVSDLRPAEAAEVPGLEDGTAVLKVQALLICDACSGEHDPNVTCREAHSADDLDD